HDGAPFNADAVVHHWSRILNPENRYRHRMFIQPIQSVEKIDDYTVRFNLAHPWAPFKVVISSVLGFSSYIPSPKAVNAGTQNRAPSGTGPYMFKAWAPDNHFIVVRNPDYWKKEAPRLDQIVFRPLPDHQTRLAGLKAGEVDMIWTDRGSHIQAAKTDKNLVTHAREDNGAEILLLNVARPPLDDPRVRRALAHAWNQALYIRMIYKDTIPMIRHPYTSAAPCGDAGYRDYDAAEAARLIREYGKPVVVEYIHTKSLRGQQGGEIMQQLFKKIGVTVNLTGLEVGAMIKKVFTRDYQLASWRISSGADQGIWLHGQLHSKSPYNFSNYANPEMDELLVTQGKTTDPKERAALFCKIAELINRDAPIIYRGGRKYHVLAAPHVKGIPPLKDGAVLLSDAWLE
ncbi:MAG: hypothetical protein GY859_13480, partial [Desulfobacterales bacterium]|nr:hypothetical protein [Desulfobacterales bacterium]